ncbi:MAG TPA: hypothetical protein VF191_09395, partial [Cyclobacteriaceae bacterium]
MVSGGRTGQPAQPKKDGDVYPAKAKVRGGKIPILWAIFTPTIVIGHRCRSRRAMESNHETNDRKIFSLSQVTRSIQRTLGER